MWKTVKIFQTRKQEKFVTSVTPCTEKCLNSYLLLGYFKTCFHPLYKYIFRIFIWANVYPVKDWLSSYFWHLNNLICGKNTSDLKFYIHLYYGVVMKTWYLQCTFLLFFVTATWMDHYYPPHFRPMFFWQLGLGPTVIVWKFQ